MDSLHIGLIVFCIVLLFLLGYQWYSKKSCIGLQYKPTDSKTGALINKASQIINISQRDFCKGPGRIAADTFAHMIIDQIRVEYSPKCSITKASLAQEKERALAKIPSNFISNELANSIIELLTLILDMTCTNDIIDKVKVKSVYNSVMNSLCL